MRVCACVSVVSGYPEQFEMLVMTHGWGSLGASRLQMSKAESNHYNVTASGKLHMHSVLIAVIYLNGFSTLSRAGKSYYVLPFFPDKAVSKMSSLFI